MPTPCSAIMFKFSAKEKNKFVQHWTTSEMIPSEVEGEPPKVHVQEHERVCKAKNEFLAVD
jgi:hypothetical protein